MSKSERLLNLLILLLVQERYVAKQRIRDSIPEYADSSPEAFEKMFERDKEELRRLGVPIEIGSVDAFFGDEPGYRVRRDEAFLPEVELTADEAAVVGLATRVWRQAGLASATGDALAKLTAAGVPLDRSRLDLAAPEIGGDDPAVEPLWQASLDRSVVVFDYRKATEARAVTRHLEPWGVVFSSGRWYVVGRDRDRAAPRVFRLSRIAGTVRRQGKTGAYEIPPDTDLRELTRSLVPPEPTRPASVLVRQGTCLDLRRRAREVEEAVTGPDGGSEWDRLSLLHSSADELADEVLELGANAFLEEPAEARDVLVDRLRRATGAAS